MHTDYVTANNTYHHNKQSTHLHCEATPLTFHLDPHGWAVVFLHTNIDDGDALDGEVVPLRHTRHVQLKQVSPATGVHPRRRVGDVEPLPAKQPASSGRIARRTTADDEGPSQLTGGVLRVLLKHASCPGGGYGREQNCRGIKRKIVLYYTCTLRDHEIICLSKLEAL